MFGYFGVGSNELIWRIDERRENKLREGTEEG